MKHNSELSAVVTALKTHSLGRAFVLLENYALCHPELGVMPQLTDIRSDYDLMVGYWKQGYKDAHCEALYGRFIRRMYRLTADTYLAYTITHDSLLGGAFRRARSSGQERTAATVRREMEGFVADMAMLELEPENKRAARRRELHQEHNKQMTTLFDYILTSPQWNDGTAEEFADLLLSPTVDSADAQLILSALTMANLWVFDYNKWITLVNVYLNTDDQQLRQHALVGWVTTMGEGYDAIFTEQKTVIDKMLSAKSPSDTDGMKLSPESIADELADLQLQIIYCFNTDTDTRTIREEIMPELIKNNNLRITPNGIEEKDDDPTEDFLDPHASEKRMAAMEEHFKRMMDMQKEGADIYFGGFAQMKRFPFFDSICNWFQPFSVDHPAITALYADSKDLKLANAVVSRGSFCNSDKYSFVIAFQRVASQLPANIREMLSHGEMALGIGAFGADIKEDEKQSPEYLRRIYLQDLYRFFRLFPQREKYDSPFDDVFFASPIFSDTLLADRALSVAAFMVKKKLLEAAEMVLDNYDFDNGLYNYYMLRGYLSAHLMTDGDMAEKWYGKALEISPDNKKALMGYAKALMAGEFFKSATEVYDKMLALEPTNTTALFNRANCLVMAEEYEKALETLYRLDFEHPDNPRIQRLLLRALLFTDKLDQAERLLEKLQESDNTDADDRLVKGVIAWCKNNVEDAVKLFVAHLKERYPSATLSEWIVGIKLDIICPYKELIKRNGVSDMDIQLMQDILSQAQ